jgi:hypothetical protein
VAKRPLAARGENNQQWDNAQCRSFNPADYRGGEALDSKAA